MFCTNIVRRPQYLKDGTPSGTYVRIGQCKDAGRYVTNTEVLVWSEPLYDIRAVFMVQDPTEGGGVSLFGCWGNGFPAQGIFPHQPTGYGAGERGAPMAYTSDYADMWSGLRTGISNGTVNVTLNGVKMDPLVTPFSGGYDLLTFDCSGNARKGDTFGSYGQGDAYVGGVEYGEILLYTNRLSSAEIERTEVYLNKKWFGKNTPGVTVAEPASLFVAEGASVTLTGGGFVNAPVGMSKR